MPTGHVLNVHVNNTDYLMLTTLQRLCGGRINATMAASIAGNPRRNRIWRWRVSALKARAFLRLVEPHLVAKRQQAQLALTLPYKAHRGRRSEEFIARSEAVKQQLMALHHSPHRPTDDEPPPTLTVLQGTGAA